MGQGGRALPGRSGVRAPCSDNNDVLLACSALQPARADRAAGVHILRVQGELDLATADALYQRCRAAIARHARLLLLDLRGLSFCDVRGLSVFGCGWRMTPMQRGAVTGSIVPQPTRGEIVRINGLGTRLPGFATIEQARRSICDPGPLEARLLR